jgi:hypothetical protein
LFINKSSACCKARETSHYKSRRFECGAGILSESDQDGEFFLSPRTHLLISEEFLHGLAAGVGKIFTR